MINELINAPQEVKDILLSIPKNIIEVVNINHEILQLRDHYMDAGVVTEKLALHHNGMIWDFILVFLGI